ncbi:TonB-dependent receptor plug domain-containing protein, partial [Myxococcota bacterium]|nr:TonB-dependent receptor plug domain-containing protein [Myxococcota bacterium]
MIQSNQKTTGLHWLLLACVLFWATAVHAEDPLFEPLIKNDGTEASEENPKELKAEEDPNAPLEKDGGEPKIRLEDGEVVIDRGGAERVIDPDDASISPVERDADPDIEEVVIIGIQRALNSALEEKRQTTNLTEIINAENVGKLPDENVAEVLENIPGVQIDRTAGIGTSVSIRGSDQNRVEINGRGTVNAQDARGGIAFSDLPAALVRSLSVTKVPSADMVEGSIGGTIDVKTYRGLKLKAPLVVGTFLGEYADNSSTWNQNLSATLGDKFETPIGDIGAILTISNIEKTVREDVLRVSPSIRENPAGQNVSNWPSFLQTTKPDGTPTIFPYFYPGFSSTEYDFRDRKNTTAQGSLEWQVADSFKLYAEGTYTNVNNQDRLQGAQASYGGGPYIGVPANQSSRELDGLDEATFSFVELGGINIPTMSSGVIGGGLANGPRFDTQPTPNFNDGLQIRPRGGAAQRKTDN